MIIKSVYGSQGEVLDAIQKLHCDFQCDVTYGNGVFYKNRREPKYKFDCDPQKEGVVKACCTDLPFEDNFLDNIVFDPPFLTYIKKQREHGSIMAGRYGGYWAYQELEDHYKASIKEASRVLKKKGTLVVKCQDIIHNHKLHCTHSNVINWAEEEGFRILDLFILTANHRMKIQSHKTQKHARIHHCYFLVFIKK